MERILEKLNLAEVIGESAWMLLLLFLIVGWKFPVIGIVAVFCMIAPVVAASWKEGRIWCGNHCPRGQFNDNLLSKISRSTEIPSFFKSVYFRIGFFLFLIYNFVTGIINANGNLAAIGLVFYKIIFVTTIITVSLGVIFHQRTWCAFCPMGSLSALVVKIKRKFVSNPMQIKVDEEKCVDCGLCSENCPLDLEPHNFSEKGDCNLDCLHCNECIDSCPVDALNKVNKN
ncbi:4Fe-4S binding protein [Halanaerobacter jeridensis]|uniref:Polyferredoxin n=1 Tax=Halanaerobacter jeridensis TaxID=706427 RepID=A0A939BPB4_9FIRM|nr:4Fe-4S binding protein [Halanaerobacter jeridensis]MBM7556598.1 polyferredoxin [Halanaerobacter jeridensis]